MNQNHQTNKQTQQLILNCEIKKERNKWKKKLPIEILNTENLTFVKQAFKLVEKSTGELVWIESCKLLSKLRSSGESGSAMMFCYLFFVYFGSDATKLNQSFSLLNQTSTGNCLYRNESIFTSIQFSYYYFFFVFIKLIHYFTLQKGINQWIIDWSKVQVILIELILMMMRKWNNRYHEKLVNLNIFLIYCSVWASVCFSFFCLFGSSKGVGFNELISPAWSIWISFDSSKKWTNNAFFAANVSASWILEPCPIIRIIF